MPHVPSIPCLPVFYNNDMREKLNIKEVLTADGFLGKHMEADALSLILWKGKWIAIVTFDCYMSHVECAWNVNKI